MEPLAIDWGVAQGNAIDISTAPNGAVWVVGSSKRIFRWYPIKNEWKTYPAAGNKAIRLAIGQGKVFIIEEDNSIHSIENNQKSQLPGRAVDIACGEDGSLFVIGTSLRLFKWNENNGDWDTLTDTNRTFQAVASDLSGTPFVIDKGNRIYRYENSQLQELPGRAVDIAAGSDGSLWVVGTSRRAFKWDNSKQDWNLYSMQLDTANVIAANENGYPWVIDNDKKIYKGQLRHPYASLENISGLIDFFSPFDFDQNGMNEIKSLQLLSFQSSDVNPTEHLPLVIVFIDSSLLQNDSNLSSDFMSRLERWKNDLWMDGYESCFIEAKVYDGTNHQDGKTVLAFREFFRGVACNYPYFSGAIFVGSFPEAVLAYRRVRREVRQNITIDGEEINNGNILFMRPGLANSRFELPLADLTGNWDLIYHENPVSFDHIVALTDENTSREWDKPGKTFTSSIFDHHKVTVEDVFMVRDDDTTIEELKTSASNRFIKLRMGSLRRNPESGLEDKKNPNPISTPDIVISRINARHVAVIPNPNIVGANGLHLLDEDGNPQIIKYPNSQGHDENYSRNLTMELKLLNEYFNRVYAFRNGRFADEKIRTATVAYAFSAEGYSNYGRKSLKAVRRAVSDEDISPPLINEDANLLEYVQWLQKPARVRVIIAHSDKRNTTYGRSDLDLLESATGKPFRWVKKGDKLKPSFEGFGEKHANILLHLTLWQNKRVPEDTGSFYIHLGCGSTTPEGYGKLPYNDEKYGAFQNAESLLFFSNGLTLIGRAQTHNTVPENFTQILGESIKTCFGDAWRKMNMEYAEDVEAGQAKRGYKIAYSWGIIGDWTLRLHYPKPDCVGVNSNSLQIERQGNKWLVDGLAVAPSRSEAQRICKILEYYDVDQVCYIGRPKHSMRYILTNGKSPIGQLEGEQCTRIDPTKLKIVRERSRWIVYDNSNRLLAMPNEYEAIEAIFIIRKYHFTHMCYVGTPNPSLEYFRQ